MRNNLRKIWLKVRSPLYVKELIFKWTAVFLLIFTFLTFLFLPCLNKTYHIEKIKNTSELNFKNIGVKNLSVRWWLALVYTSAIFFGLTLKVEKIEYKRFWGTLYIVLVYTLGIVCLAYIANFIIQK